MNHVLISVVGLLLQKMSSLLSAEMTTTRTKTRKTKSLFHGGRKGKCPHSLAKNIWMDERASSFLGIKSTEKFTKKHATFLRFKEEGTEI